MELVDSGMDDNVDMGPGRGCGGDVRTVSATTTGAGVGSAGMCVGCGSAVLILVGEGVGVTAGSGDLDRTCARLS